MLQACRLLQWAPGELGIARLAHGCCPSALLQALVVLPPQARW